MADTRNRKTHNRQLRQEALRDQLSAQGHLQHVVDLLDKLMDDSIEYDKDALARVKLVLETKLKLINKYLPDPKQIELSGGDGEALTIKVMDYSKKK